jgi:hypothetical protein
LKFEEEYLDEDSISVYDFLMKRTNINFYEQIIIHKDLEKIPFLYFFIGDLENLSNKNYFSKYLPYISVGLLNRGGGLIILGV